MFDSIARLTLVLGSWVLFPGIGHAQAASLPSTFACSSHARKGAELLNAASEFDGRSAGWEPNLSPSNFDGDACSSTHPFLFSIPATDGVYQVTVVLGGPSASVNTIKAEARRLFLLNQSVPANGRASFMFNVAVRTPVVSGDQNVKLKPREIGDRDWDDKLTLEFNGTNPSVRSITVRPVSVPTIYLAGDSTVVDQSDEPWAAWGQMLPVFFDARVAIANNAESGETIKSFTGERRLAKIMTALKPGDYLFVQFAHNDQKPGTGFVSIPEYKDDLRMYISQARSKGATPVLVTSMNRRRFDETGHIIQTLGDYPQAMRDIAAEQHVALIDLNALSKILFEAWGPSESEKAFVFYPANSFPNQPKALEDNTHFNSYGAYELARAIVADIERQKLPIAKYLKRAIPPFDISHPDPVADFHLPASPFVSSVKPYER